MQSPWLHQHDPEAFTAGDSVAVRRDHQAPRPGIVHRVDEDGVHVTIVGLGTMVVHPDDVASARTPEDLLDHRAFQRKSAEADDFPAEAVQAFRRRTSAWRPDAP